MKRTGMVTLPLAAILALSLTSAAVASKPKSKTSVVPTPAAMENAKPPKGAKSPSLIITIVVDQFSADLFAQYRAHFTGGFKRLAETIVFPSGYQSHAATETCPGHSTILTGAHPARSGVIANNWFDLRTARTDKKIYCAEDESIPNSSSDNYTVSPIHLRVPTLGDRIKSADAKSRVVSVAGKDRAAVMLGGHKTDEAWWWASRGFTSYTGKMPPPAVTSVNAAITQALPQLGAVLPLAPICQAMAQAIPVSAETSVGGSVPVREPGDARGFRATPALDIATLDIATGLMKDMKLGSGPSIDLLAIGLSATDYVGHTYGTSGIEMCNQLMTIDGALAKFFASVDALGINYVVVLTADHGGHDLPERNKIRAINDAARISTPNLPSEIDASVAETLKLEGFLITGDAPFGDFYIAPDETADRRKMIIAAARVKLLANPQVAAVFSAEDLKATPKSNLPADEWTLAQRAAANFDPTRSGDFYVILKPHITPIHDGSQGYVATHGSAWNYDRRVPILFWWKGATAFEQPNAVETVDIMPTLASLIGLPVPASEIDGRCLDLVAGVESNCPK